MLIMKKEKTSVHIAAFVRGDIITVNGKETFYQEIHTLCKKRFENKDLLDISGEYIKFDSDDFCPMCKAINKAEKLCQETIINIKKGIF